MRLPRTSLLATLTDADAPSFIVLEAPTGFGKSWLLRNAAPPGALRVRGELGPIASGVGAPAPAVIIDDAHLLGSGDVARLVAYVEDAPATARLIVAGRILPDAIHDVAHLVDGLILDASALAVTADEITAEATAMSPSHAAQLVEAADGSIRVISASIDRSRHDPRRDVLAAAVGIVQTASAAALQHLGPDDRRMVGLLARSPGIDQGLLLREGDAGFMSRALAAGVPLRRQVSGGIDLVSADAFRTSEIDAGLATRFADALIDRGRPVDAVGLLLDAGAHDRAASLLMELPESVTRTVEPRAMLALLGRLGTITEREPALLLMRAAASAVIGRIDVTGADIDRALSLADTVDPPMRRRVTVEAAEWLLVQGRRDQAVASVEGAIRELGPGEDRTYARAHAVLADAASTSVRRADLQRAAEWYRVAAVAWEGCGEFAKARLCRCDLATAVLGPLGRFDEALAQLATILAVADVTDAERSWMLLNEGFILLLANRLESAESRFERVSDLGYVQDNPRIIAAAAWGRAMVAARRDNVSEALRWIGTAENTGLGEDDDLLGLPFHCDVAIALGGLGEFELAERHLAAAKARTAGFTDTLQLTEFIVASRRGVRGDVAAQLDVTPPAEWWRVLLVSALAAAREGDPDSANRLLLEAERQLITLGFSDFRSLGERRTYEELRALLRHAPETAVSTSAVVEVPAVPAVQVLPSSGRRIRVFGGPITLEHDGGVTELPSGNPQRLVGVVVAHGGIASFDQLSEAIWPGDDVEISRARLRNVLLRLRRVAGNILVRSGSGVRIATDVECDLYEFDRLATDSLSSTRTDPDLAGVLAAQAVRLGEATVFGDFEYEEWAVSARRNVESKLIGLLDLLSVQAEDAGDLPMAQSLAERALTLDRYSDSRYVRLAELLTLQGRTAAAVAVLEDAAEVARDLGGAVSKTVKTRRDTLMRRASSG